MNYTAELTFEIFCDDESVLAEALERPYKDPTWRESFYELLYEDEVLSHLLWNVTANHVTDISQLDGWADIPKGTITFKWAGWPSSFNEPPQPSDGSEG